MTYKLVEQLVLNAEGGTQRREAAYAATLEWLERLKAQGNSQKSDKLSLLLYPEQLGWLNNQVKVLEKKPEPSYVELFFWLGLRQPKKRRFLRILT